MNLATSFKSSSETLAYGLDLTEVPVNELVARSMPDDPEEQQLLLGFFFVHLHCQVLTGLGK